MSLLFLIKKSTTKLATFLLIINFSLISYAQYLGFEEYLPKPLPNVAIVDLKNKQYNFEKFEGNVLILHFWATWCSGCKNELQEINAFQKKVRKDPIIVLPISEDYKTVDIVEKYYETTDINNLPIFIDPKNRLFKELGISTLPTTVIIDAEGNMVAKSVGKIDWANEDMVPYLLQFLQAKTVINPDYQNIMQEQFGERFTNPKKDAKKEPEMANDIPIEAHTNLEEVKSDSQENAENDPASSKNIEVSNIDMENFSLKIKRPVNKKTEKNNANKVN